MQAGVDQMQAGVDRMQAEADRMRVETDEVRTLAFNVIMQIINNPIFKHTPTNREYIQRFELHTPMNTNKWYEPNYSSLIAANQAVEECKHDVASGHAVTAHQYISPPTINRNNYNYNYFTTFPALIFADLNPVTRPTIEPTEQVASSES